MTENPAIIWRTSCALAVLVLVVAGCDSRRQNRVPDAAAGMKTAAAVEGTQAGTGPPTKGPKGVGNSCVSPKDCPSYLWCYDETCKVPPSVSNTHTQTTPTLTFQDAQGKDLATFYLELALTPPEREKGLMFRRRIPKDWGMLFVYPDERPRSFWMQNTFIPLDMVFIDAAGRIVNIIANAAPLTRVQRNSEGPARYVLELAGGRAAEVGLHRGQTITLAHIAEKHKPRR